MPRVKLDDCSMISPDILARMDVAGIEPGRDFRRVIDNMSPLAVSC
jgi:hypothetical protein